MRPTIQIKPLLATHRLVVPHAQRTSFQRLLRAAAEVTAVSALLTCGIVPDITAMPHQGVPELATLSLIRHWKAYVLLMMSTTHNTEWSGLGQHLHPLTATMQTMLQQQIPPVLNQLCQVPVGQTSIPAVCSLVAMADTLVYHSLTPTSMSLDSPLLRSMGNVMILLLRFSRDLNLHGVMMWKILLIGGVRVLLDLCALPVPDMDQRLQNDMRHTRYLERLLALMLLHCQQGMHGASTHLYFSAFKYISDMHSRSAGIRRVNPFVLALTKELIIKRVRFNPGTQDMIHQLLVTAELYPPQDMYSSMQQLLTSLDPRNDCEVLRALAVSSSRATKHSEITVILAAALKIHDNHWPPSHSNDLTDTEARDSGWLSTLTIVRHFAEAISVLNQRWNQQQDCVSVLGITIAFTLLLKMVMGIRQAHDPEGTGPGWRYQRLMQAISKPPLLLVCERLIRTYMRRCAAEEAAAAGCAGAPTAVFNPTKVTRLLCVAAYQPLLSKTLQAHVSLAASARKGVCRMLAENASAELLHCVRASSLDILRGIPPLYECIKLATIVGSTLTLASCSLQPEDLLSEQQKLAATCRHLWGVRDVVSRQFTRDGGVPSKEQQAVIWGRFAAENCIMQPGCCNLLCIKTPGDTEDKMVTHLCEGCRRVRYCSEKCQREAWLNGHKGVCGCTHTVSVGPALSIA